MNTINQPSLAKDKRTTVDFCNYLYATNDMIAVPSEQEIIPPDQSCRNPYWYEDKDHFINARLILSKMRTGEDMVRMICGYFDTLGWRHWLTVDGYTIISGFVTDRQYTPKVLMVSGYYERIPRSGITYSYRIDVIGN